MSSIHFIGGEKGGVGKSLVARLLAQYCIDKGLPFAGFDSDKSHGALMRFYAGFATPVKVEDYSSLDQMIEVAIEDPNRRIIVDLAAQTQHALVRWIEESGLLDLGNELGLSLTYWHVMDSGKDSVDLLRRWLDEFAGQMKLVVVLNEVRSKIFTTLEESGELDRALAYGAQVVSVRQLHEGTMQKIDSRSTSFWAAINNPDRDVTGLSILERQRVRVWFQSAYQELEGIAI
ncbi:MAG: hypothetical protein PW790_11970 [Parvibaculaceae bacterium]|nr:hypothetical protein [Parvibaculaceae bacterium]